MCEHVHMCVSMSVRVCATCAGVQVCVHVCKGLCTSMHMCTHVRVCACVSVCTCVCACKGVCVSVWVGVHMCASVCMCVHASVYVCATMRFSRAGAITFIIKILNERLPQSDLCFLYHGLLWEKQNPPGPLGGAGPEEEQRMRMGKQTDSGICQPTFVCSASREIFPCSDPPWIRAMWGGKLKWQGQQGSP